MSLGKNTVISSFVDRISAGIPRPYSPWLPAPWAVQWSTQPESSLDIKPLPYLLLFFDKNWTEEIINDSCILSAKLIDHLAPHMDSGSSHLQHHHPAIQRRFIDKNLLYPATRKSNRITLPLTLCRGKRNPRRTFESSRYQIRKEIEATAQDKDEANSPQRDYDEIEQWTWSLDFKGLEKFVNEHGHKGGGMTDG
jgi:hypothetical protein